MNRRLLLTAAFATLTLAACKAKAPRDNSADIAYLAQNAMKPGVTTTPSGLQYRVIQAGDPKGAHPAKQDEVKVHYEGRLIPSKDATGKEVPGKVFDSSYEEGTPRIFEVGGLVPGWVEALQIMRPGDIWELVIPANLGYGDMGAGDQIPPGATLIFKMELLGVLPHPAPKAFG